MYWILKTTEWKSKPMKERVNEGFNLEFLAFQAIFSYLYSPFEMHIFLRPYEREWVGQSGKDSKWRDFFSSWEITLVTGSFQAGIDQSLYIQLHNRHSNILYYVLNPINNVHSLTMNWNCWQSSKSRRDKSLLYQWFFAYPNLNTGMYAGW